MKNNKTNNGYSKLWKILNSGFFIWFLSAVVIGSSSFLYTKWYENTQKKLATEENIEKLDLEISSRLSFFAEQIVAKERLKDALLVLENPQKSNLPISVFPEYSQRSLRALLWELQSLVNLEEKKLIKIALKETGNFKKIYLATLENPEFLMDLLKKDRRNLDDKIDAIDKDLDAFFKKVEKSENNSDFEDKIDAIEIKSENNSDFEDKIDAIEIKPIHITIDLNLNIQHDIELVGMTMEAFNLTRWGKPFDDLAIKIGTESSVNGKKLKRAQPSSSKIFQQ